VAQVNNEDGYERSDFFGETKGRSPHTREFRREASSGPPRHDGVAALDPGAQARLGWRARAWVDGARLPRAHPEWYLHAAVTLFQPTYERPPEGLARGRWGAPPWAIGALGAVLVVGAVLYLVWRARRAVRSRGRR
jgi:hypothetical protein